jgi:UDP-N-acetyl-2-amino-2-deoxyglucuronate dehydrogenase
MSKKNKIRVGIIGCGMIFDRHVEAINANRELFELVAICDIDSKKVSLRAKEFDVPGYEDYRDMLLKMKGKMDMVSICTPNSLHFGQAKDALASGYDILVEKPVDFKVKEWKSW